MTRELNVQVAEAMGWRWDDAWGCLIPPEQTAGPDEMWTDWHYDHEGDDLHREPAPGAAISGIVYNGNFTKIILPEHSTDIAAAWPLLEIARAWKFSKRHCFFSALSDSVNDRVVSEGTRYRLDWFSGLLLLLEPADICRAFLAALKEG